MALDEGLIKVLELVAPGKPLREGLESVLRAKTGALIVVGDSQQVIDLVNGGFEIDAEFTPANLYELAKMDGAIILSYNARKILRANAHLVPNATIPSVETGIRHRTAERVAKQTNELVISISQRRNIITLYYGYFKYILQDINVILAKANQALQTLEKYKKVLDRVLVNLTILEFEDMVTVYDVVKAIQRAEMVLRVKREIEQYISELGTEGRLISMQMEELVENVYDISLLIIRDYRQDEEDLHAVEIKEQLANLSDESLLDLNILANIIGFPGIVNILEMSLEPRGYRVLRKIPRLPLSVIDNVVKTFASLQKIIDASIEALDDVEGIGEVRARAIKEGLQRLKEQATMERYV